MGRPEVVITGYGVVSTFGWDVDRFYAALAAAEVAIRPVSWMPDGSGIYAAPVEGFRASDWMSERVAEGSDLFAQFALAATTQALAHAGLAEADFDPLRTAVVIGTMGGTRALQRAQSLYEREGIDAIPLKAQIQVWPNMAAGQIAMRYQLHGPSLTISTACASSLDAVGTATRLIQAGQADVAIAGASEGANSDLDFVPAIVANRKAFGMLAPVCRPFDRDRAGIADGDGAGMFMLESRAHAEARGATVHGVVRGYASLADAYHPSSPEPSGQWEALVMRRALEDAALPASLPVAGLYAHATGTPSGDAAEIRAVNAVYGDRDEPLPVTSLKGHFGHPAGSAAALNLVAGLTGMARGEVLPTASTRNVDAEARFHVVLDKPHPLDIRALQFNAFGFGGQNASLVVARDPG